MLKLLYDNAISADKLYIGSLYIYKSGRVALYLGRDEQGKYMFYIVGAVELLDDIRVNGLVLYYEDLEKKYLIHKATEMLQGQLINQFLIRHQGIPVILYEIPFMTTEELYKLFAKRNLLGLSTIQLKINQNFDYIDNPKPLKAKELKVGFTYVGKRNLGTTDEGNPAFIYLGRDSQGNYKYLNIGGLSGVAFNKGFDKTIEFCSKHRRQVEYTVAAKTVYKPIYYKQYAEVDTSDILKKFGLI